ncbi:hypothetical protein BS50DRAFT_515500 [Corynespora cassiicola Philippines]|uniref:AAA+ ATPase domain-containing protein n=1 Tax=Corynespora cassiicola Philippines TaxID=1448308 RepID=A0A2T2P1Z0_CORCC|nr:hypothetical protein BS50DRAFT_515500 [Corynespora cassiicola Philippines]
MDSLDNPESVNSTVKTTPEGLPSDSKIPEQQSPVVGANRVFEATINETDSKPAAAGGEIRSNCEATKDACHDEKPPEDFDPDKGLVSHETVAQEFADRNERRLSIQQRREERDKQRWHHIRYMRLLDDRLDSLEHDVWEVLGIPKEELKAKSDGSMCIPGIKYMSWDEYQEKKGDRKPLEDGHSAIDVLVDEPVWFERTLSYYLRGEHQKEKSNYVESSALYEKVPERMRINSADLIKALREFSPNGMLAYEDRSRLIMRRPFKFLTHNDEHLRKFTENKEKELAKMVQAKEQSRKAEKNKRPDSAPSEAKDFEAKDVYDANAYSALERTIEHLHLLLRFTFNFLASLKDTVPKRERISFQDVHFLFSSGQILHIRHKDHPQKMWRLVQITGGNRYLRPYNHDEEERSGCKSERKDSFSPFVLSCYFLAFDGTRFRRVFQDFAIPYFSGEMPMKKLWILPLEVASENGLVNREHACQENQQYLECTRTRHFNFTGRTLEKDSLGNKLKLDDHPNHPSYAVPEFVDGNVMIDFDKAYQLNPWWRTNNDDFVPYKVNPREWESLRYEGYGPKESIQGDFAIDVLCKENFLDEEDKKIENWDNGKVEGDDILVLPDRVPAFFLRSRKWVFIPIGTETKNGVQTGSLKKVEKSDEAWNNLQLPGEENEDQRTSHKYIVQSLVDRHFAKGMNLDIVRNKGRGLIVLLHGAPGVGKTSTAECVAEAEGKPLLPITCGDLGLDPQEVEKNLSKHFELAQHWECILLLDEADVFLAARRLEDLNRNALVSVFLRILEYYEGILFLTTNKVGLIDEAFKSRIHMALHYPWLDESQTINIWKSLVRRAKSDTSLVIDEVEIIVLASQLWNKQVNSPHGKGPDGKAPGWNGRQIKNAFMSAIALAQYEAKKNPSGDSDTPTRVILSKKHFNTVETASKAFDDYLWKVHAYKNDSKLAEAGRYRVDGYGYSLPGLNTNANVVQYPAPVTTYHQVAGPPQNQYAYQTGASFQAPSVHPQPVNMGPPQPVNMAPQPPPNQGYAIRGETIPVQNQGQFQQSGYQQHVEYQQYPGQAPQQPHLRTSSEQHPQQPQGVQNIYSGNSAYGQLPVQPNPDRQQSSFQG